MTTSSIHSWCCRNICIKISVQSGSFPILTQLFKKKKQKKKKPEDVVETYLFCSASHHLPSLSTMGLEDFSKTGACTMTNLRNKNNTCGYSLSPLYPLSFNLHYQVKISIVFLPPTRDWRGHCKAPHRSSPEATRSSKEKTITHQLFDTVIYTSFTDLFLIAYLLE